MDANEWQPIELAPNNIKIVAAYFGPRKEWHSFATVGHFFKWDSMPEPVLVGWPTHAIEPTHFLLLPEPPK